MKNIRLPEPPVTRRRHPGLWAGAALACGAAAIAAAVRTGEVVPSLLLAGFGFAWVLLFAAAMEERA